MSQDNFQMVFPKTSAAFFKGNSLPIFYPSCMVWGEKFHNYWSHILCIKLWYATKMHKKLLVFWEMFPKSKHQHYCRKNNYVVTLMHPLESHQCVCWRLAYENLCQNICRQNDGKYREYMRMIHRDYFMNVPSQWETMLQRNIVSHWLGTFTKWSLIQDWNYKTHTSKTNRHNTTKVGCRLFWDSFTLNNKEEAIWFEAIVFDLPDTEVDGRAIEHL